MTCFKRISAIGDRRYMTLYRNWTWKRVNPCCIWNVIIVQPYMICVWPLRIVKRTGQIVKYFPKVDIFFQNGTIRLKTETDDYFRLLLHNYIFFCSSLPKMHKRYFLLKGVRKLTRNKNYIFFFFKKIMMLRKTIIIVF